MHMQWSLLSISTYNTINRMHSPCSLSHKMWNMNMNSTMNLTVELIITEVKFLHFQWNGSGGFTGGTQSVVQTANQLPSKWMNSRVIVIRGRFTSNYSQYLKFYELMSWFLWEWETVLLARLLVSTRSVDIYHIFLIMGAFSISPMIYLRGPVATVYF